MSNNLRSSTSGIDCEIQEMQTDMYEYLNGFYTFDVSAYGRSYKNKKNKKDSIPEVWNETKQEYEEVFLDDNLPFKFFFMDDTKHKTNDGILFTADIKIVFCVNLSLINSTLRNDSEVHKRVIVCINDETFNEFVVDGLEKGVEEVFRGYSTENITYTDIHPWHVFAITGTLSYYLNKKC